MVHEIVFGEKLFLTNVALLGNLQSKEKQFSENIEKALGLLKRFLDDYVGLYIGPTKKLHQVLKEINKINPTIQLTMKHPYIEDEAPEDKCSCPDLKAVQF